MGYHAPEFAAPIVECYPHGLTGSKLTREEYEFSQTKALTGFDPGRGPRQPALQPQV